MSTWAAQLGYTNLSPINEHSRNLPGYVQLLCCGGSRPCQTETPRHPFGPHDHLARKYLCGAGTW